MKLLVVLLLLFTNYSFAFEKCGDHPLEKKYPDLTWLTLADVNVYSTFADVVAVICIGKLPYESKVQRIIYRDDQKRAQLDETVEGLKEGRVLIGSENLPLAAAAFVRKGPIMALRIDEIIENKKDKITFKTSIRFLRNLSKGFSGKDFREVKVDAILDYTKDEVIAIHEEEKEIVKFDALNIFLSSLPIKINQLQLEKNSEMKKVLFSSSLPVVDGFFN